MPILYRGATRYGRNGSRGICPTMPSGSPDLNSGEHDMNVRGFAIALAATALTAAPALAQQSGWNGNSGSSQGYNQGYNQGSNQGNQGSDQGYQGSNQMSPGSMSPGSMSSGSDQGYQASNQGYQGPNQGYQGSNQGYQGSNQSWNGQGFNGRVRVAGVERIERQRIVAADGPARAATPAADGLVSRQHRWRVGAGDAIRGAGLPAAARRIG